LGGESKSGMREKRENCRRCFRFLRSIPQSVDHLRTQNPNLPPPRSTNSWRQSGNPVILALRMAHAFKLVISRICRALWLQTEKQTGAQSQKI